MAESSLPRDRNDNMSESWSVSTFGDLSPIRNTDANDVSMIDFEVEYALLTTEESGDTNADTYVLFMMSLKYNNYCLEFKSLQHDCLISYVSI
jgi:hypothetical protein